MDGSSWNVSGGFAYDHNFKNHKTNYLSGDIIDGDDTLTRLSTDGRSGLAAS
jgi:hypothetical protein